MGLSQPRTIFGIHSIAPYNPANGEFYGMLRVLGNGTFSMSGESIELRGGSNKFPWAVEAGQITAELALTLKEYPDFIFELFMGKAPTTIAADAAGAVRNFANVKGTSILDVANGMASVGVVALDKADLKFGKYVIKAVTANTFDVYVSTDADLTRGTDKAFENDLLKVTTTPLSLGATVALAGFGIEFVKVGTPAFVVGDTASFGVLPPHAGGMEVIIGNASDTFVTFGAILMTQKKANGELFEIDVFALQGAGGNLGANEKAFSETSLTAKASYDSVKGGIAKLTAVKPS
jgi:hypothetical protein